MRQSTAIIIALGLMIGGWTAQAAIVTVGSGGTHATISAAITAAAAGDEIQIIDGATYTEAVTVPAGKNLTLRATPNPAKIVGRVRILAAGVNVIDNVTVDLTGATQPGVSIEALTDITFSNCTIEKGTQGNLTGATAAGAVGATIRFNNCILQDAVPSATNNGSAFVCSRRVNIYLTDCIVRRINAFGGDSNNQADAIRIATANANGTVLVMDNVQFSDIGRNAVVHASTGSVTIDDCSFTNIARRAISLDQGFAGQTATIRNCTFLNIPTQSKDAVNDLPVGFYRDGTMLLEDCTFTSITSNYSILTDHYNVAQLLGPGNYSIRNNTFTNCKGGVRHNANNAAVTTVTLQGNTFNTGSERAIYVSSSNRSLYKMNAIIEANVINDGRNNTGSLIRLFQTNAGSRFVNNLVDQGNPAVGIEDSEISILHNTFVNADLSTETTALSIDSPSTATIKNNIIQHTGYALTAASDSSLSQVLADYNLMRGGVAVTDVDAAGFLGANNILGKLAGFTAPSATVGAGDYTLNTLTGSMAINAGDPAVGVTTSLNGAARPLPAGTAPDMGCYENTFLVPVKASRFSID